MTNGPESADAPRRSRRAADVPVDAAAGPRERESQQRARDREALRAYKALADKQSRLDESATPPTRRQLRLAQQQQRAAAAGGGSPAAASSAPAQDTPAQDKPVRESSAAARPAAGAKPAAAAKPATAEAPSRRASANAGSSPASAPAAPSTPANRPGGHAAGEGSRRERRRRALQEEPAPRSTPAAERTPEAKTPATPAPPAAPPAAAADVNADVAGMTVEQALLAREALQAQARNQVAAMEAVADADPHAVDLELLAQQKALAERAAVLNRRTQNIQRLSQENEQRKPSSNDPTTAHNLAMVTPLEFVRVPGVDRPMMKRPPTSHVPIVTSNTPKQRQQGVPAAPQGSPRGADKRFELRRPSGAGDVRHSRILARADALVNAPLDPAEGAKPIGARSAFGLDPLDVMTAGLGRTRRLRFVSLGIGGLGLLALIISVVMTIGGFGS
ncbi:hypothetical protein J2M53_07135 [Arthrobacter sp. zg-ZUI100]|uniref:hypothetical protein n=1 Tax=Arthrobacter jiangjiafuii TaxID=2817475 RepID=UPI001AEEF24A|nr:hypothetical protein [Arthrobacter jiangjiafuii]MBP3036023.1 hypothetical protein [Arthrobacter jiangjiafuii]